MICNNVVRSKYGKNFLSGEIIFNFVRTHILFKQRHLNLFLRTARKVKQKKLYLFINCKFIYL